MSFFSHNYVKYLTKPCHNDIILLVDALAPIPTPPPWPGQVRSTKPAPCLCRPSSYWHLRKRLASWTSVGRESALSRGANPAIGGYDDPRKTYRAKELDLPFRNLLKSYRGSDPAPKPQLALPIPTIQIASSGYEPHHSPWNQAISDLTCMVFFFLLRVGKYTMPSPGTITRTVQFRLKDVHLWRQGSLLNNFAPRAELMTADAVTLYLKNQKNGNKGATIHHTAVAGWFCLVKALIRQVSDIASQGLRNEPPLSCISPGSHITSLLIVSMIREAAQLTHLTTHGYNLKMDWSSLAASIRRHGKGISCIPQLFCTQILV
jgi:hypothetical protein